MPHTPSLVPATELAERNRMRFPNESDDYRRARTALLAEEMTALPANARLDEARDLFVALVRADRLEEFLTVPAYARID